MTREGVIINWQNSSSCTLQAFYADKGGPIEDWGKGRLWVLPFANISPSLRLGPLSWSWYYFLSLENPTFLRVKLLINNVLKKVSFDVFNASELVKAEIPAVL